MTTDSQLSRAAALVAEAPRLTVLSGAGVSTESGIPDFRGPKGVWTTNPETRALFDYDTYLADPGTRRQLWQLRRDHPAWRAEPGPAHHALARFAGTGRLRALVTQNIDGLHQRAGTPSERVIEVHGTLHYVVCLACGGRTPTPEVLARLADEPDPPCLECGGIQKVDTISFGQQLREDVLAAAVAAAQECAVFLAVGTSLSVQPVAGLCDLALRSGAELVVVNAEPTPYDAEATAALHGRIGEVLPQLLEP